MTADTLTDEELWTKVKADDQAAFRQLFDRYYKYLLVTVVNVTGDRTLAKDAAQEVFFELWKKRSSLTISSAFKAYIRRAVLNRSFNVMKTQSRFTDEESIPERQDLADSPLSMLENNDLQRILNQSIEKLPERCRMVFTLCRIEGMSHKEIAEQMGTSTKTVEHQMTKALKILKDTLTPYLSQGMLFMVLNFFLN
ncbi:MAG: RNA polymerase sigma-70 factor (ECF subfamily) [Polaribacter sp.]|jgi:RNA polymerase sigma-70 factor (ECF subfamily)